MKTETYNISTDAYWISPFGARYPVGNDIHKDVALRLIMNGKYRQDFIQIGGRPSDYLFRHGWIRTRRTGNRTWQLEIGTLGSDTKSSLIEFIGTDIKDNDKIYIEDAFAYKTVANGTKQQVLEELNVYSSFKFGDIFEVMNAPDHPWENGTVVKIIGKNSGMSMEEFVRDSGGFDKGVIREFISQDGCYHVSRPNRNTTWEFLPSDLEYVSSPNKKTSDILEHIPEPKNTYGIVLGKEYYSKNNNYSYRIPLDVGTFAELIKKYPYVAVQIDDQDIESQNICVVYNFFTTVENNNYPNPYLDSIEEFFRLCSLTKTADIIDNLRTDKTSYMLKGDRIESLVTLFYENELTIEPGDRGTIIGFFSDQGLVNVHWDKFNHSSDYCYVNIKDIKQYVEKTADILEHIQPPHPPHPWEEGTHVKVLDKTVGDTDPLLVSSLKNSIGDVMGYSIENKFYSVYFNGGNVFSFRPSDLEYVSAPRTASLKFSDILEHMPEPEDTNKSLEVMEQLTISAAIDFINAGYTSGDGWEIILPDNDYDELFESGVRESIAQQLETGAREGLDPISWVLILDINNSTIASKVAAYPKHIGEHTFEEFKKRARPGQIWKTSNSLIRIDKMLSNAIVRRLSRYVRFRGAWTGNDPSAAKKLMPQKNGKFLSSTEPWTLSRKYEPFLLLKENVFEYEPSITFKQTIDPGQSLAQPMALYEANPKTADIFEYMNVPPHPWEKGTLVEIIDKSTGSKSFDQFLNNDDGGFTEGYVKINNRKNGTEYVITEYPDHGMAWYFLPQDLVWLAPPQKVASIRFSDILNQWNKQHIPLKHPYPIGTKVKIVDKTIGDFDYETFQNDENYFETGEVAGIDENIDEWGHNLGIRYEICEIGNPDNYGYFAPDDIEPLEKYVKSSIEQIPGSVYNQAYGYRINSGFGGSGGDAESVLDILKYEAYELGNEDMKDALKLAKKMKLDLAKIPASDCIWICRTPEDTHMYGYLENNEMATGKLSPKDKEYVNSQVEKISIPPGSIVLSDLGQDGVFLLLNNKTASLRFADVKDIKAHPSVEEKFKNSIVKNEDNTLKPYFHGTPHVYKDYDLKKTKEIGFHFAPVEQANTILDKREHWGGHHIGYWGNSRNIRPVFLNIHNPVYLNDVGDWSNCWEIAQNLDKHGYLKTRVNISGVPTYHEISLDNEHWIPAPYLREELIDLLKSMGYDSIAYKNQFERGTRGKRDWTYIPFDTELQVHPAFEEYKEPDTRTWLTSSIRFSDILEQFDKDEKAGKVKYHGLYIGQQLDSTIAYEPYSVIIKDLGTKKELLEKYPSVKEAYVSFYFDNIGDNQLCVYAIDPADNSEWFDTIVSFKNNYTPRVLHKCVTSDLKFADIINADPEYANNRFNILQQFIDHNQHGHMLDFNIKVHKLNIPQVVYETQPQYFIESIVESYANDYSKTFMVDMETKYPWIADSEITGRSDGWYSVTQIQDCDEFATELIDHVFEGHGFEETLDHLVKGVKGQETYYSINDQAYNMFEIGQMLEKAYFQFFGLKGDVHTARRKYINEVESYDFWQPYMGNEHTANLTFDPLPELEL